MEGAFNYTYLQVFLFTEFTYFYITKLDRFMSKNIYSYIFTGYYYECNSVYNQKTKINCYLLGSAVLVNQRQLTVSHNFFIQELDN